MNISNNTIFITGGAAGIGLGLAKAFLQLDNQVIIGGRNAEKLAEIKVQLPKIETILCDVANEASLLECAELLKAKYPSLNILINNAGIMNPFDYPKGDFSTQSIDNEVFTNLLAPMKLSHLLLPILSQNKNSAIMNVTSGLAYLPMPSVPIYSATKAALHSFSISLRVQLKPQGIEVFEILPPVVDTNMPQKLTGKGKVAKGKKMSVEKCIEAIIKGLKRNRYELRIGDNRLLYWVSRLMPAFAQNILNKL
jgi:short-subunit dehydrogenase involved in D-alanine esterification of teichoic acids